MALKIRVIKEWLGRILNLIDSKFNSYKMGMNCPCYVKLGGKIIKKVKWE